MDITHNGTSYLNIDAHEARAFGVPDAVIEAAQARAATLAQREARRGRIMREAGDTQTLLGSTADGAHLLLIHMARLATALKSAQNIAQVRAAATPFADLMEAYLAKLDANPATAKLPYAVKPGGEAAALEEIETRATAVAQAFEEEEG